MIGRDDLLEFQDTMGNQLVVLNLKYRHCLDRNEFPVDELEDMVESAGKVFLALHKFRGIAREAT